MKLQQLNTFKILHYTLEVAENTKKEMFVRFWDLPLQMEHGALIRGMLK
jgi:hypothetical protein